MLRLVFSGFEVRRSTLRLYNSVQVKVANRAAGVGRFFGLLDRFLEFLFQEITRMFLGFYRLAKDRFPAAILLFHRLGSLLKVIEHLGLDGGSMGNDSFRRGIDIQRATPQFIPSPGTLANYRKVFRREFFWTAVKNSFTNIISRLQEKVSAAPPFGEKGRAWKSRPVTGSHSDPTMPTYY